jgi:HPt (histidine-containing phosphotransfer) domain-containing protein
LESAVSRGVGETIRFEAHAIKGGAMNLCANRLGEAARQLEESGREGRIEDSAKHLESLRAALLELSAFPAKWGGK